MQSVVSVLTSVMWCSIVFCAITGYGAVLLHLIKIRNATVGLSAIAGFGIIIFLGGILNAAKLFYKPALLIFVAIGFIGLLYALIANRFRFAPLGNRRSAVESVSFILFVVVLLAQLGMSAAIRRFHPVDDANYYLAASEKVMQTHQYGFDPFSERRVTTSIGGGYFLNSLILVGSPLQEVPLGDRGLGALLCAALVFDVALSFQLSRAKTYLFGALALAALPPFFNISFIVLPYACFIALPMLLVHPLLDDHPAWRGVLLGTLGAVSSACKSTNVVQAVVFTLLAVVAGLRICALGGMDGVICDSC